MQRIVRIQGALLVLLAMAVAQIPSVTEAQDQSVVPASGPAGTTFTFSVSGFDGNERVGYWLNVPNGTVLAIGNSSTYASKGRLTKSWTSRVGVPLGTWQFVAQGVKSGTVRVLSFQVTEAAGAPAPGITGVVPPVGVAGGTFTFYATGFQPGERVGYWLNVPTGAVLPLDDRHHYADGAGQFSVIWQSPAYVPTGTWQLVAQGTRSGVVQVLTFQISS
jgi:hypothetical protein